MKRLSLPFLMLLALACSKDSSTTNLGLPTVQNQVAPIPASQGSFIECHPYHGHGPTKWVHIHEDGTKLNLCTVDCVCYYGCPR